MNECTKANDAIHMIKAEEIDQEIATGINGEHPLLSKKKLIKKSKRRTKRPIRRRAYSSNNVIV